MSMDTATTNVSGNTMQTSNSSLFPKTMSYMSDTKSDVSFQGVTANLMKKDDLYEQMERLNLVRLFFFPKKQKPLFL